MKIQTKKYDTRNLFGISVVYPIDTILDENKLNVFNNYLLL